MPTRPAASPGGILGTGSYQVEVRERGGGHLVGVLAHSTLRWSRGLDDMSSADVVCAPVDEFVVRPGQIVDALAALEEWEHELWVFRDTDRDPVWLGPITPAPVYTEAGATVYAKDLFAWLERRFQPLNRAFASTDLSTVFRTYLEDALAVENSMGIRLRITPSGISGARSVQSSSFPRTADLLRELGRVGVDWTMVGRVLVAGGIEVPTPDLPTLVDDVLLDPQLSSIAAASRVVVVGGSLNPSSAPPQGVAEVAGSPKGLVEVLFNEPLMLDQISVDNAAASRLDFLGSGAAFLSATLDPSAPVDFSTLVPGAKCHVQLLRLAKQIDQEMRLLAVDVSHEVTDQGETEKVRATFSPIGTVAA